MLPVLGMLKCSYVLDMLHSSTSGYIESIPVV